MSIVTYYRDISHYRYYHSALIYAWYCTVFFNGNLLVLGIYISIYLRICSSDMQAAAIVAFHCMKYCMSLLEYPVNQSHTEQLKRNLALAVSDM